MVLFFLRFHNKHKFFAVDLLLFPFLFGLSLHLPVNPEFFETSYNHQYDYMEEQTVLLTPRTNCSIIEFVLYIKTLNIFSKE